MESIIIPFSSNNLGRVDFWADVMTNDRRSFGDVRFKLDSGSDFTTIDCRDLYKLGYTNDFLGKCPFHPSKASTASTDIRLQYLTNVSLKFENREIQSCRIFFALDTQLRSLFGSDILKYFNWEVNYDDNIMKLVQAKRRPSLSEGETSLYIYSIEC